MSYNFNELGEELKNIVNDLMGIGCCKLCVLRFIGETEPIAYTKTFNTLLSREPDENQSVSLENKVQKCNPCVACLGCLQVSESGDMLDKIAREIIASDYDSPTFKVALTFPVSFQLRAHAMWLYMTKQHPEHCKKMFPIDVVTINVKDVWKYAFAPYVGERVSKKFDQNSNLNVTITMSYKDDLTESMSLLNVEEQLFGRKKKGRRQKDVPESKELFSRKSVELVLKKVDVSDFTQHFKIPPSIPSSPASCESVFLCQESIYIAGRYNKLSRVLSQTPWMIDGERRMDDSVEEIISEPVKIVTHAQSSKFLSSGREDVDVRTLGRGRPFAVECIDPHRTCFSNEELRAAMLQVNKNGMGKVAIRDLQLVSKNSLELLKKGEDTKTKEYCALCIVHGPLPCNLAALNSMAPITLSQRTPVRVLHRRPAAMRPRTIHRMKVVPVQTDNSEFSLFKLYVETQAGTYVKEFVHGDFGRTKPSVGDLLGDVSVDILALDVMNVNLDWPPTLS